MENYKEEIEKLQTQLDELKSKIEKPKFKAGKWYKIEYTSGPSLINFKSVKDENYGFSYNGNWSNNFEILGYEKPIKYELATTKEVQEALTKEAVKRGFKIGTKYYSAMWNDETLGDSSALNCRFKQETNTLYMNGMNGIVFHNGIWATPIKTKTIEDLVNDLYECTRFDLANYITENKQTIIETLNNL